MSPRALAAWAIAWSAAAWAQEGRGFAELRLSDFPGAGGDKVQVVERVRPTLQTDLGERVKLVATIEGALAEGRDTGSELERTLRSQGFGPLLDAAQCHAPTHANSFFRIDDEHGYLDVDRLYLDWYHPRFDLRVGRQAINWGSARFFNPTDPFPQVFLTQPWLPRRGVNAARLSVPFGEKNDATAVVAIDDALKTARAAARARVNWKGTDFAAVGVYRGDTKSGLVGLDLRGTLGVGWWFEGAWVFNSKPHEEISAGLDYSFPVLEQLVVFAQYYRNGSGASSPDQYAALASRLGGAGLFTCASAGPFASSSAPDPFAPFTVARDYLLLGATLTALPELTIGFTGLQNLDDGTLLAVPMVTWAALDWLDLSAMASVPAAAWGKGGEFKPRPQDLTLTVPDGTGGTLTAHLKGLEPSATLTVWARASF